MSTNPESGPRAPSPRIPEPCPSKCESKPTTPELRRHARSCPTVPLTHDCLERNASPLERLLGKEQPRQYREALGRLKPRDRRVILLRISENLTYDEIADRLQMPTPDAARVALSRALSRLTVALKNVRAGVPAA